MGVRVKLDHSSLDLHSFMEPPAVDFSSPSSIRNAIRHGFWRGPTSGVCPGYLQAKYEFLCFLGSLILCGIAYDLIICQNMLLTWLFPAWSSCTRIWQPILSSFAGKTPNHAHSWQFSLLDAKNQLNWQRVLILLRIYPNTAFTGAEDS